MVFQIQKFKTADFGSHASLLPETLPEVPFKTLCDALMRLGRAEREIALQRGVVLIAWMPDIRLYALVDGYTAPNGMRILARIPKPFFDHAVQLCFAANLAKSAALSLRLKAPIFSASRRLYPGQRSTFLLVMLAFSGLVAVEPQAAYHVFSFTFFMLFFLMMWFRVQAVLEPSVQRRAPPEMDDAKLPPYTVLVPLFRETSVLPQLLAALQALSYPTAKLDIKLLIEESDTGMHRALAAMKLPRHMQTLIVPAGKPQTKPRALNYGLNFARGSLLTIYDAEDIPEPMQLRAAARAFACLPARMACLQAELAFYNSNENWLTRQFTAEYATLFKLTLPMLSSLNLPLPLGGTSNHFRVDALRAAGGWDPYNVTEDADLGFRMARLGYKAQVLGSTTYEEANTEFSNWVSQRARWFKGFIQTWHVHMRRPLALINEIGLGGFVTLQATILGVVATAALYPIFLVTTVWHLLDPPQLENSRLFAFIDVFYMSLFFVGQLFMVACAGIALARRGMKGWWFTLATLPVYWMLASFAAWLSVWQFIHAPFHWNKTRHGLSRFVKNPISNPKP